MAKAYEHSIERALHAQWNALDRFAREICDQPVDRQSRAWLHLASESLQVQPVILEAVYLVERYHRRWVWRMAETAVTVVHYAVSRLFDLSPPDYSIGICQIKPSVWYRARAVKHGQMTYSQLKPPRNEFSLRDLINLLSTEGSIFAAAEVLSYEVNNLSIRGQRNREIAELLVENHFGFGSWPDGNWVDLADLLFLVISFINERDHLANATRV